MEEIWTIQKALKWTQGYLGRKGDPQPRLSAEWLLSEATGHSRVELYMCFDEPLSPDERQLLRGFVSRRGTGEPLQYISGRAPFRYINVKVAPGVLIPRPETEVLVSEALALLPPAPRRVAFDSTIDAWEGDVLRAASMLAEQDVECVADNAAREEAAAQSVAAAPSDPSATASASVSDKPARPLLVADICTGSGCVACAIAIERPDTRLFATDISPVAVKLARENAADLDVSDRGRIEQGDLGQPLPAGAMGRLDLVVSNPPYVPTSVLAEIPAEVADFEPSLALDGGADGNDVLRRLLPWSLQALKSGGAIAVELHETRLDAACDLAREAGFTDVGFKCDLSGKPRVLIGRKPV